MNRTLLFSVVIGICLIADDSFAQDHGNDRGGQDRGGFGGPPGSDRGGQGRGGFGGPPGGDRRGGGRRPNFMQFLPVLKALDTDQNGEISSKELANASAALKTLDKNGDGKLTEDEVRPERPPGSRGRGGFGGGDRGGFGGSPGGDRGGQGRGGFGGPPGGDRGGQGRGGFGGPPGGQSRGGGRPSAAGMTERMMAFDKNKDGKLTTDEVSERMHPMLKEADTDGDGAASKAEISKLAEKRAGQGDRRSGARGGNQGGTQKPQRPAFDN